MYSAPNNAAFEAIASVASTLTSEQLLGVISAHAVLGQVIYSTDIMDGLSVNSVAGSPLTFSMSNGTVSVTGGAMNTTAAIVRADVPTMNGVVHVIDAVLV